MPKNIYLKIILLLVFAGLTSCATTKTSTAASHAEQEAPAMKQQSQAQNSQTTAEKAQSLAQNSQTGTEKGQSPIQNSETLAENTQSPAAKTAESADLQGDAKTIWSQLQTTSSAKLRARLAKATHMEQAAWFKLALISKQSGADTKELIKQLTSWRQENPNHPGNALFPDNAKLTNLSKTPHTTHVALLLPLQGPLGAQGQAVRDGFLSSYYDKMAKPNQTQTISFYDTSKNPNITALYQQALADGADIIVGPLTKDQVQTLSQQNNYPVPTIELNYTDVSLGSLPNNLFQFGLSQKDEAEQLATKAWNTGHSRAIIIAPQDPWSQRITKPLIDQWQSQGGVIADSYYYSSRMNLAEDVAKLMHINTQEDREQMEDDNTKSVLEQQRRHDFDVIFLIALPQEGRVIVPLLKYYYADNIPIYSTSIIYSGAPSPHKDADLNGVIFCDLPWVFKKPSISTTNRLYAVGRDAQLISNELQRLEQLPNFPIYAATGALTMNDKQQIYRRVPWAQMHAGHP